MLHKDNMLCFACFPCNEPTASGPPLAVCYLCRRLLDNCMEYKPRWRAGFTDPQLENQFRNRMSKQSQKAKPYYYSLGAVCNVAVVCIGLPSWVS